VVIHDHPRICWLWKHKPEGCLDREILRDASTVWLNEVFRTLHVQEILGKEIWIS
jgi:hypothetical protein